MQTHEIPSLIFAAAVLTLSACRNTLPCPDCDDDAADQDDAPMPDLPCGGADLMSDNLNCGSCGNECILWYADTEYVAGTCVDGVCGPGWSTCFFEIEAFVTCADVCTALGQSCVANGCAGYTGILSNVNFDGWGCGPNSQTPVAVISGGCDEPIPWMTTGDNHREVQCCCDFQ